MSLELVAASNQFAEVATNFSGAITDYPLTVVVGAKITDGTILGCLTWYGTSGATNVWAHSLTSDGVANGFACQSRNTATDGSAIGTTDPATVANTWVSLAARHTSAVLREVFLNGVEEAQNTVSHLSGTENRFSVGHFGDATPSNPASAIIAYVAIYSAAISDSDVASIHNGADPRSIAGLVELWDFTRAANQYVGMIGGVTLTPSNSPTFVADAPSHTWLAVNAASATQGTAPASSGSSRRLIRARRRRTLTN